MRTCLYKPEELLGQPIGQHHCPDCGMMVMAGMKHPTAVFYAKKEDITQDDHTHLGQKQETGWFFMDAGYTIHGPFSTEADADLAYDADRKARWLP